MPRSNSVASAPPENIAFRGEIPDPAFFGRVREIKVLLDSLRAANCGEGRLVLIGGEPGIGKTRLAERGASYAGAAGARVLWGRSWEGDGAPSFWPWIQVLRGLKDSTIAPQFPEIGAVLQDFGVRIPTTPLESEQSRFWLFDVVSNLLRRVAADETLLIVLDDLHWADPASLVLLEFVVSELSRSGILIIGAYRDVAIVSESQLAETVATISRHHWTRRISLQGLSTNEVAQVIENIAGFRPTDRIVKVFQERTGGNPYFLTETARLLQDERTDIPSGVRTALPDTVREAVRRRLKNLPTDTEEMLTYASVVGHDFDVDLLIAQTSQSAEGIHHSLDYAVKAKLIAPTSEDSHYRFAHALTREFIYEQTSPSRRMQCHALVAARLEDRISGHSAIPLSTIAHHYAMAHTAGDSSKAFAYSIRAAEQAFVTFAYEDAVNHYLRALVCPPANRLSPIERCHLMISLGEAQRRAGDWQDSRETFKHAASIAREFGSATLLARSAVGFAGYTGHFPVDVEAVSFFRDALSSIGPDDSGPRVQLLAALALSLHFDADPAPRIQLSADALSLANRVCEPALIAEALESRMMALIGRCDPSEFERLAAATLKLAEHDADAGRVFRCHLHSYHAFLRMGRSSSADEELRYCAKLSNELRYPRYLWQMALMDAARATMRGRFATAQEAIYQAQHVGQHFDGPIANQYQLMQQVLLLHTEGQLKTAESFLRRVLSDYPDSALARAALANACASAGNTCEALDLLEWFGWNELQGVPGVLVPFTFALAAEAASIVRDEVRAAVLYELLKPSAAENVVVSWGAGFLGSVSHYLGLLAASLGRFDRSTQHFEDALLMNAQMRTPPLIASTQRRYAEMLLARDAPEDREHAVELLDKAMATFEALEMKISHEETRLVSERVGRLKAGGSDVFPVTGPPTNGATQGAAADSGYMFRRENDYWTVVFEGMVSRLRHTWGMAVLAELLKNPGKDLHVLDLTGAVDGVWAREGQGRKRPGRPRKDVHPLSGDAGPVSDARAREEYRQRVEEVRAELAEAEGFNDAGRAASLRAEYEELTSELARAYGRHGPRRAGANSERARIRVRNNMSKAISSLDAAIPAFSRHLRGSLRTGTFCSYQPERNVPWTF